jgi:outer membrane protein OmpA-like peptidoglycan-associated protein
VVDGANRQSVNSSETAEGIALRVHLSRIQAALREEQARPAGQASRIAEFSSTVRPGVVSIRFPVNGTSFRIGTKESTSLLPRLGSARRIEVRGRTDGERPSAADERIALNRALAAQRYLIGQGVSPAIISVNYVSAGDYVADNATASGKSQNRRVDIEVFNQ